MWEKVGKEIRQIFTSSGLHVVRSGVVSMGS